MIVKHLGIYKANICKDAKGLVHIHDADPAGAPEWLNECILFK